MFDFCYPLLENVVPYLERIGWQGDIKPDKTTLDALIYAHQRSVPFENLSACGLTEQNSLAIPELYKKVVAGRRGGYCFELNGIFMTLLRALGYDAYSCMARVASGTELRPVMHRAIIVRLDGRQYYCDVGFGGAMAPFAVELSARVQSALGENYWVEEAAEEWLVLYRRFDTENEGKPVIVFSTLPFLNEDFTTFHLYCSRNPESAFTEGPFLYRRTANGFLSYDEGVLSGMENGQKLNRRIPNEELRAMMAELFDLYI